VGSTGPLIFTVKSARWRPHDGKWQVILTTTMENTTGQTLYGGYWRYRYLVVAKRPSNVRCFSPTADSDTVGPGLIDDERVGFDVTCKPTRRIGLVLENGTTISVTPTSLEWGSC
jgi:hypothetical protein